MDNIIVLVVDVVHSEVFGMVNHKICHINLLKLLIVMVVCIGVFIMISVRCAFVYIRAFVLYWVCNKIKDREGTS